jgi:hypothetical protein
MANCIEIFQQVNKVSSLETWKNTGVLQISSGRSSSGKSSGGITKFCQDHYSVTKAKFGPSEQKMKGVWNQPKRSFCRKTAGYSLLDHKRGTLIKENLKITRIAEYLQQ